MSSSITKRRLIRSLPSTLQNPDLTAFFGATVDEVFQPGDSEPISGYIGHAIPGSDNFYVAEPTSARMFYQLEPGMVSFNPTDAKTIDYVLTYPDAVSYFTVSGGITSDQGRMFETDYYVWAPPINIDMLINYRHYYWFGDIDSMAETAYIFNTADKQNIVLANSNLTALSTAAYGVPSAVRTTQIGTGLWYIEFYIASGSGLQYCGLANTVDLISGLPGKNNNTPGSSNAYIYCSSGQVFNDNGNIAIDLKLAPYGPGDYVGMAWNTFTHKLWFRVNGGAWQNAIGNPASNSGGYDLTSLLANGAACALWAATSNDCQVTINFGSSAFAYAAPTDYIGPTSLLLSEDLPAVTLSVPYALYTGDGVTTIFALPNSILAVEPANENPTVYVNNMPVEAMGTMGGDALSLNVAPAPNSVVMLCRTPDLANAILDATTVDISDLNTQNVPNLTSSMRINIIDTSHLSDAWDSRPWDWYDPIGHEASTGWDASSDANYIVDGIGTSLRLTPLSSMVRGGLAAQYVTIDRSSRDNNSWSVRNSWVHEASFAWSGEQFPTRRASRPIIEFVRDIELYTGQIWTESADPLFTLYDLNNVALNNKAVYPHSTFAGNRIFGYAQGSGPIDPILRRALKYDNNGYIMFSNDSAKVEIVSQASNMTGLLLSSEITTSMPCYAIHHGFGTLTYFPFWHQANNTTVQGQTNGNYNVPANLAANPDYEEVNLISKSTWQKHFTSMIANQLGYVGTPAGDTNYRDTTRDLTVGSCILQHHAPMLKTMLLALEDDFDLPRAIRYAELEYNRFRNKFARKLVDLLNRGVLQTTDLPSLWVSAVLDALKLGHSNDFPFALSTMAGGQYFIPPTPTGLCLQPAATPGLIIDTSYGMSKLMLLGHDGSLSLTFGDWRDEVMLELETLIYQNLPIPPNTMLPNTENRPTFDIQEWIGGRFYTAYQGYTGSEVATILAPMFELWAQINRMDYRANDSYDATNPFTWNYRGVLDTGGNALPGHWRGIYQYYYDTDAPHTRPWEMLGFACEPTWWASTYGAAPYTLSNIQLWIDLQGGVIAAGPRAGSDPRYARPGLLNLLPVDLNGNLLDPVAAGIVTSTVTIQMGTRNWIAGDGGPAETLWRHSPSYCFALARASYLMKPARCVEMCWDAIGVGYVAGQWVELASNQRPRNSLQYVHGETTPGTNTIAPHVVSVIGISQWLADYLVSIGQHSSTLGTAIRGLNVALVHPMAGFVSVANTQLIADSFGLLPAEDIHSVLYTSPAVASEVYSGVIIQWTGSAWSVVGFDGRNPSFTIIPPNVTGTKGIISLASATEPSIVPWRSGTYYPTAILVEYQNSVYQCIRSHTSGVIFETTYWTPRADLATAMIRAPRVVTYNSGLATTTKVPYGTEYTSYQDIADFLLGWQRWLVSRGWSFTSVNSDNQILDWHLSVEEFLSWAQVQWAPGNFIALSPGQAGLQFNAVQGTILNVEDNVTGFYGLIDRSGAPISQRNAVVTRLDGNITIAANSADIFLARLNICNIEHALVPSNVTIFNDNIYLPLYNLRQERLLLLTDRALGWAGRLDAPGFVINGNILSPSFENAVEDVRLMFDIEHADVDILRDYARHNVGMQERKYMDDLQMQDHAMFEFYQGMIQQKGTPSAFQAIARSTLATNNTTLNFLEEWAFRVDTYGAPLDPFITFQVAQSDVRDDPQLIRFQTQVGTPLSWIELASNDPRWYDKPESFSAFFPEGDDYTAAALPTSGPVRLGEVQNTAYHISNVPGLYNLDSNPLPAGSLIWVYNSIPAIHGINWYVDVINGKDSNTGRATVSPLASLQLAHDYSNPGDTIYVAAGTYSAVGLGTNILEITRSGTAAAPITYVAMPGTIPLIVGSQSNAAVHFNAVSHIVFQGFEIAGWSGSLTLSDVQALSPSIASMSDLYNGSGIVIDRGTGSVSSHHITILDCTVHDFPYNGILANWCDYITIQGCTIYSNAEFSIFAGSGINILNCHGIDNISTYKVYVQQNICYDNINLILNIGSGNITDGCGIAIAGNQNDYTDGVAYRGRTLVQNNLVYNNGGIGIQINDSAHVDVIFNTAYYNQTNTNHAFGEIIAYGSKDCNIYNNILDALPNVPLATSSENLDTFYSNNIGFGGNDLPMPGVYNFSDPLFVDPTVARDFTVWQGSNAIGSANPKFTTNVDVLGNLRTNDTGYDIGCYQREGIAPPLEGTHPFTVLRSFDTGTLPNAALVITTPVEDNTLLSTRISFQLPITLTSEDVGNYVIIDGNSLSAPELQGLQVITAVHNDLNSIDIVSVGTGGYSFLNTPTSAPIIRVLRSVRFPSISMIKPNYPFVIGDLVWIDNYNQRQWVVLRWDGSAWNLYRIQPRYIDSSTIGETVIYSTGTQIINRQMILNQPTVADVVVIDPMAGLICNLSDRDIDFKTEYDPARYNVGYGTLAANVWGRDEVGRVWWDMSTVRFLDPFTDTLGLDPTRDLVELQYRLSAVARVAPGSSIDVYEWTESSIDPIAYAANPRNLGTIYNAGANWVARTVFDPARQHDMTLYYFWVKGSTLVPNLDFRHISVSQIALGIENPAALNVSWMSAISPDALVISGVSPYLNETSTVMKVRLITSPDNVGHYDEWRLMRPLDASSLPTDHLWGKVRDGLAGFEVSHSGLISIPDPSLTPHRNTGINDKQNMFNVSAVSLSPWQGGVIYYYGDVVSNNGFAYQCTAAGISASIYVILSNGQHADYTSGSGFDTLTFLVTGAGTAPYLTIDSLVLNSSTINDIAGNLMDLSSAVVTVASFNGIITVSAKFKKIAYVTIGTGPSGYSDIIADGTVTWAYHGVDGSRSGLLAARKAFVDSVNNIFAANPIQIDRSALLATLRRTTSYPNADLPYLIWAQTDLSYPYEPPPDNEWSTPYEVYSIAQRNDLLATEAFAQAILKNTPISVLISGFANTIPQWSIWKFDPAAAARIIAAPANRELSQTSALLQNAAQVFSLKTTWEYIVANETERNNLIPNLIAGDRVMVKADTGGFWAIWIWSGFSFNLWRMQTYDTSSFINSVDWYDTKTLAANRFNVNDPPIIVYNTTAERDSTEGRTPNNLLVKVLNTDASVPAFTWTAFISNAWVTVAIENGTIALSPTFYQTVPYHPVHGVSTSAMPKAPTLSDVTNRDGSWELYILVHALRYTGLLQDSEINQLWFDIINFVHVQQNDVDWAFKTSFMTLAGINAPMTQTAVQMADQTGDVTDYINEVKPYRVKLRETTTQYVPEADLANFTVTDFDDPVYVDPISGLQRPLDPTNTADIAILTAHTDPWIEWYQNYALPFSPVRSILLTILFDRVVGTISNWDMADWDTLSWDDSESNTGAGYRITTYYEPTADMPPLDLTALLNLNEKESQINDLLFSTSYPWKDDGGTFIEPQNYDIDINPPLISQPGGFDLRAPYDAPQHPEERVVFGADDNLTMIVTADPLAGGPPQIVKVFDLDSLSGTTTTLFIDMLPHSLSAVMVFCDGLRAVLNTDYTVDYFNRSIDLNLTVNGNLVKRCVVHVFGFGGNSAITEQNYLTYGTNALILKTPSVTSNVLAVVDGTPVDPASVLVIGTNVTLTDPPADGSDVALLVYAGGITTATQINIETLTYTSPQTWTLSYPDLQTIPPHAGTILEVNGLRLTPPTTFYGSMNIGTPWMYLPLMPDITTSVSVYIDNVLYAAPIPIATGTSQSSDYPFGILLPGLPPPTNIAGQFVLYNHLLVALDTTFICSNVIIVMQFVDSPPDYTVSSAGVLTITPTLSSNDTISVTTFDNAGCMGIKTVTYVVGAPVEHIVPTPFGESYSLVTMNGFAIVQEDDYTIQNVPFATGDAYFTANMISIINPTEPGSIVVMSFTGSAARETMTWLYASVTPAFNRMFLAPREVASQVPAGWDATPMDSQGYDNAQVMGVPAHGPPNPKALFSIQNRFETIRLSPYMAGTLVADLGAQDTSLSINLFVQPVAVQLQENNPLPIPDAYRNQRGAIWIEGERIEYFGYTRVGNVVTLSVLRRATRGTSMGIKRLVLTDTGDGTAHTYTFTEPGIVDVEFNDIGQPPSVFNVTDSTNVTLTAPVGAYIVIGLTISASHLAGTPVWNGKQIFEQDIPLGPPVGNRELQPMKFMICGG